MVQANMEGALTTHEMSVAANHRRKSVDNAALSQEDLAASTLSPSHIKLWSTKIHFKLYLRLPGGSQII